jgi:cytoskeletal protein CcmA (bactofilin family)
VLKTKINLHINQNLKMKKIYTLVILLSMGITQIYAQQCFDCDDETKAFTIGTNTIATGDNSFAGGNQSGTSTDNSFVFGNVSIVSGLRGIALGNETKVLQADGIAIGSGAISDALNSYVFGKDVKGTGSNSITIGMGSSDLLPLSNSKPNSIMFGVSNKPSLTIVKPAGADIGYLGIGTDDPKEMVHIENGNLLLRSSSTSSGAILFGIDEHNWGIERENSTNEGVGLNFWLGRKAYDINNPKNLTRNISVLFLGENGHVGVGTKSPASKLDIAGSFKAQSAEVTGRLSAQTAIIAGTTSTNELSAQTAIITGNTYLNGDVGIGTNAPQAKLDVDGSLRAQSASITGTFTANALSAQSANITNTLTANTLNAKNANINGTIKTKEVNVTLAGWPDFVFDEDYELMPLSEVEQFITENKHLPNVPSEAEVMANGVNVGEMNAILLQKVEELTLYIIDLQKQIDELKK